MGVAKHLDVVDATEGRAQRVLNPTLLTKFLGSDLLSLPRHGPALSRISPASCGGPAILEAPFEANDPFA